MNTPNIETLIPIIKEAGAIVLDGARAKDIKKKGDSDFVTDSDLAVQNFLRARLTALFPDIAFLSEEEPDDAPAAEGALWILDPIDGTMNFIRDLSLSAVSLALVRGGETVLGIVYNPFLAEMFYAERGGGAFLNGKRIHVSDRTELDGSLIAVGTSPYYKPTVGACFDIYRELFLRSVDIRRLGSAAIDICYVAAGRFDGYYEYMLSIWDYAAARLILAEAGGRLTNTKCEQTKSEPKSPVVTSNSLLHETLINIINKEGGFRK